MRIKIQKKGYVGDLTIDESQLKRFERKGWENVQDKAIETESEEAIEDADIDKEIEKK